MADRTTDGASPAGVDPVGRADAWESVLASGISETGIDPAEAFPADDPTSETPQPTDRGSSAEQVSATPPAADAGDDGRTTGSLAPTAGAPPIADPSADPIPGAQPFTFDVDGQPRTIEGAFRIPGEGLYVPEDRVPHFQDLAVRAETLDRTVREITERTQSLERLTAWKRVTGLDAQGKAIYETLTGSQGLEAMRVATATFAAKAMALDALLANPNDMAGLLAEERDAEGKLTGYTLYPDGKKFFDTQLENATIKATGRARETFAKMGIAPPPPEPSVADRAGVSITALVESHKIDGLTADDIAYLTGQFGRYVSTSNGQPTIDPEFLNVMKDRAALRAEQRKATTAAETAGKFNGGMTRGRTAPKPVQRAPAAPTAPAAKVGKAQAWSDVLDSALQDMQTQ